MNVGTHFWGSYARNESMIAYRNSVTASQLSTEVEQLLDDQRQQILVLATLRETTHDQLDADELRALLEKSNFSVSAGRMTEGHQRFSVRPIGELSSLEEVRNILVRENLRLGEIADVALHTPERNYGRHLDRDYAIGVAVNKTTGTNLVDVTDRPHVELIEAAKAMAAAAKKASRVASEGIVGSYIHPGARIGVLIEVNCETDFVAKDENFVSFADAVAERALTGARFGSMPVATVDGTARWSALAGFPAAIASHSPRPWWSGTAGAGPSTPPTTAPLPTSMSCFHPPPRKPPSSSVPRPTR